VALSIKERQFHFKGFDRWEPDGADSKQSKNEPLRIESKQGSGFSLGPRRETLRGETRADESMVK
jgi:hypothetical protein